MLYFFFFFKQKTAYEMRISDWSSDVCSSDLGAGELADPKRHSRGDILLFGEDIVESLPRHLDQPGDLRLGLVERGQNVLPQQLTGVHRGKAGYELVDRKSTRLNSSH